MDNTCEWTNIYQTNTFIQDRKAWRTLNQTCCFDLIFTRNKTALTSKRIHCDIKANTSITHIYIVPVVLYGLECINLTVKWRQKVKTFQTYITFVTDHKLSDRISVTGLQDLSCIPSISYVVKSEALRLFGHVKLSSVGLCKTCVDGIMQGSWLKSW